MKLTRLELSGFDLLSRLDADTPVMRPRRAVVIGGGNVAMDSVRTCRRLGATRRHGTASPPRRTARMRRRARPTIRPSHIEPRLCLSIAPCMPAR